MSVAPAIETDPERGESKCLARSVTNILAQEPALEAVTVDRARKTISVATLGRADVPKITERVAATIQGAQQAGISGACGLLSGESDCHTCASPLTPQELRAITIRREGDATTIARVTCLTAPRFSRLRDIPFPQVVQHDVEFIEHAEHLDDWKPHLVGAALCGIFGLPRLFLEVQ